MPAEFVVPPALSPGDSVAIVAPSSGKAARFRHVLALGLERLRDVFDLEPVVYPTARQGGGFLGDNPRARAADLHAAFRDPEIRGVFAAIGGADQLRVLRYLDPAVLAEYPTRFFGMSDNTNLSLFLWNLGVVSFNGGQVMNELAVRGALPEYTERYCRRAFFEDALGALEPSPGWTDEPNDWWGEPPIPETPPDYEPNPGWSWRGGEDPARGRLWGGCHAILAWQLAADRYLPDPADLDGAVLALETSGDLPHPTDVAGTLMAMGERGLLRRFDAVLVGRPPGRSHERAPPPAERERYRARIYDAIVEEVTRYNPGAPVVCGLDWGHTTPVAPLPIGGRVSVDPGESTIVFQ